MSFQKSKTNKPVDWELLSELFDQCQALPSEQQTDFVERIALEHPEMAVPFRDLISKQTKVGAFLKDSPGDKLRGQVESAHEALTGSLTLPPELPRKKTVPLTKMKPFQIGKYLLIERLGYGGMAEVYRGKLLGAGTFSKQVAIKRILPNFSDDADFKQMFEYEAHLSSFLNHANIVQTFDFIHSNSSYLLAMEYINGRNLRQIQEKTKDTKSEFPMIFSAFLLSEVCKGLHYAHTKKDAKGSLLNIIHRDLSPQNIMVGFDGAVKLVDFGIAKAKEVFGHQKTATGTLKGKFGYMSPEQASCQPIDHRTDVFGAGLVLFELLTGHRAIQGNNDVEVLQAAQRAKFPIPSSLVPTIPSSLDLIVGKALAKDLKDRYSSALEMSQDLLHFLQEHSILYGQKDVTTFMEQNFALEIIEEQDKMKLLEEMPSFEAEAPPAKEVSVSGIIEYSPPAGSGMKIDLEKNSKRHRMESTYGQNENIDAGKSIGLNWIFFIVLVLGGGFAYVKYRGPATTWVKAQMKMPVDRGVAKDPDLYIQNTFDNLQAPGGAGFEFTQAKAAGLGANQVRLHFIPGEFTQDSAIEISWVAADGGVGPTKYCSINRRFRDQSCPYQLITAALPLRISMKPYQKNPTDIKAGFTEESCLALGSDARLNALDGTCSVSVNSGDVRYTLHFQLR